MEKMKKISDLENETISKEIDRFYEKLSFNEKNGNDDKIENKEIWEVLYEAIPYNLILESEDVLNLVLDTYKDNYKENLILLKELIFNLLKKDSDYKEDNEDDEKYINYNKDYLMDFGKKEHKINGNNKNGHEYLNELDVLDGELIPNRKEIILNKVIRNQNIVKSIKELYNDTCQLCNKRLEIALGGFYSEVHHIKPLGNLHNGSDTMDNLIVLCPNCHILFDRGSIGVDINTMSIIYFNVHNKLNGAKVNVMHRINLESIEYHNENIFINRRYKKNGYKKIEDKTNKKQLSLSHNETIEKSIDYGDNIDIQDLNSYEVISIEMKVYWERKSMPPLQKKLINKRKGELIEYNGFKYEIIKVIK